MRGTEAAHDESHGVSVVGTAVMELYGLPSLIRVLMTRYRITFLSGSSSRNTSSVLKNSDSWAPKIRCYLGRSVGKLTGPTARQAIENLDGSSARPRLPDTPPVSARET
jgi:hypothetical protein